MIADINFAPMSAAASSRAVNRTFRRTCSECSSADLGWMTPTQLAEQGDNETKARVAEGLRFIDGASDAWLCHNCGNWGLM